MGRSETDGQFPRFAGGLALWSAPARAPTTRLNRVHSAGLARPIPQREEPPLRPVAEPRANDQSYVRCPNHRTSGDVLSRPPEPILEPLPIRLAWWSPSGFELAWGLPPDLSQREFLFGDGGCCDLPLHFHFSDRSQGGRISLPEREMLRLIGVRIPAMFERYEAPRLQRKDSRRVRPLHGAQTSQSPANNPGYLPLPDCRQRSGTCLPQDSGALQRIKGGLALSPPLGGLFVRGVVLAD